MYAVSKELPLKSYQLIKPAENATNFSAGQVIRFTIPRSIGFWEASNSRLQLLTKVENATTKMAFLDDKAGVASCIDMIRVSQGGTVISEILEYATLQRIIKTYSSSAPMLQRDATQKGLVDDNWVRPAGAGGVVATGSRTASSNLLLGQSINGDGSVSLAACNAFQSKFQLSLDFVSLFEVLQVVPSLAMGDLMLEIRLIPDDKRIMKCLPATSIPMLIPGASFVGGIATATGLVIMPENFKGFTCLADSPYIIGMFVQCTDGAGTNVGADDRTISALAQDPVSGRITITLSGAAQDLTGAVDARIIKAVGSGTAPATNTQFIVSRAELQLQVITPPAQYRNDQMAQIQAEGMMLDVPSWTTYRNTVQSAIKHQTLQIPTTQDRAVSVFSVLQAQTAPVWAFDNSTDWTNNGEFANLFNYRTQIDGVYYPNQPVSCSKFHGRMHFAQEHVRELEKALIASSIVPRSLVQLKQNFVIARALAKGGASMNLTGTPINVYLEYINQGPEAVDNDGAATASGPFNVISYLHHITRIAITDMGVQVMA